MVVAKKRLQAPSLKIATGKTNLPVEKTTLYKVKPAARVQALKKNDTPIPFDKWNLPPQEDGYIKGRDFDFL